MAKGHLGRLLAIVGVSAVIAGLFMDSMVLVVAGAVLGA